MVSCRKLLLYLALFFYSAIGRPKVWESTIYPGMKQALINVMQVAQDEIEQRKVCHNNINNIMLSVFAMY